MQSISKALSAALLLLFRGQHSEKNEGSARGNWDPREGQQPFRPTPNGIRDSTTKLGRLLIAENRSDHSAYCQMRLTTTYQEERRQKLFCQKYLEAKFFKNF